MSEYIPFVSAREAKQKSLNIAREHVQSCIKNAIGAGVGSVRISSEYMRPSIITELNIQGYEVRCESATEMSISWDDLSSEE